LSACIKDAGVGRINAKRRDGGIFQRGYIPARATIGALEYSGSNGPGLDVKARIADARIESGWSDRIDRQRIQPGLQSVSVVPDAGSACPAVGALQQRVNTVLVLGFTQI
jgi:hypothetical protein